MPLEQVIEQAIKLSADDREKLLVAIEASLSEDPSEVAAAWDAEIERRVREVDSGREDSVPMDEVFAKLRRR